jgi:hypothetical protein
MNWSMIMAGLCEMIMPFQTLELFFNTPDISCLVLLNLFTHHVNSECCIRFILSRESTPVDKNSFYVMTRVKVATTSTQTSDQLPPSSQFTNASNQHYSWYPSSPSIDTVSNNPCSYKMREHTLLLHSHEAYAMRLVNSEHNPCA